MIRSLSRAIARSLSGGLPLGGEDFSPLSLFASGEQGAWYDPSDLSSMFQDSGGVTPVTAVEQVVGLIYDKRKGLALGPDIVSSGVAALAGAATAATYDTGTGAFACTRVDSSNQSYITWTGLTANASYQVTVSCATGSISFRNGGYTGSTTISTVNAGSSATGVVNATAAGQISITSGGGTSTGTVTLVKLLSGNHATQATTAQKPVLSARKNLLTFSEQFDNAAWSKVGGVVTPNTTVAPDGTTTADTITFPAGTDWIFASTGSALAGKQVTISVWLSGSGNIGLGVYDNVSSTNVTTIALTGTLTRYSYTCTVSAGATDVRPQFGRVFGAGTATSVVAWGFQLEYGSTATAYQWITTATNYDTVGFPMYLKFDGADDSLATAAIDFSATDKITTWGGHLYTNATTGILVELSVDTNANRGFYVSAVNNSVGDYGFAQNVGASSTKGWRTSLVYNARPCIHCCQYDGAAGTAATWVMPRMNGVLDQGLAVGSGTGVGNFNSYPLYIGRRAGATLPFSGNIYSLIIRGVVSTAEQIAATETYVAAKTGVTL